MRDTRTTPRFQFGLAHDGYIPGNQERSAMGCGLGEAQEHRGRRKTMTMLGITMQLVAMAGLIFITVVLSWRAGVYWWSR